MKIKKELEMSVEKVHQWAVDETELVLSNIKIIKTNKLPSPGQKVKVSWEEEK